MKMRSTRSPVVFVLIIMRVIHHEFEDKERQTLCLYFFVVSLIIYIKSFKEVKTYFAACKFQLILLPRTADCQIMPR